MILSIKNFLSGLGPTRDISPFQNIDELGKLVNMPFTHYLAPECDPLVFVAAQRRAIRFRIGVHRAEFVNIEGAAKQTDPFLLVDNRTA